MTFDPKTKMWAEACALIDRAEQLRRQFFEPARPGAMHVRWEPPVDVFETDRDVCIIAALPGVAPEDICVEMEGNTLIIVGVRPLPKRGPHAQILRLEIPYGRFERRITLSPRLELSAREVKNGCLVLTLTKLR